MRWLFADPNNAEEADHLRRAAAAIERWWQAFQAKATDIDGLFNGRSDWDLSQFMEDTLQAIDPRLMWEFGSALKQPGHRLVITPESERWLRPMVRTVLQKAPKIPGWEFYAHRLAVTPGEAVQAVKDRVGVDITGALIDASVAPGRKIDLKYVLPGLDELDDETAMEAAFVATENLMGEQVLDAWIGEIGLLDSENDAPSRPLPMERAQATVAALIRGSLDQLPSARVHELVKLPSDQPTIKLAPPEKADDYPGRDDLIEATTHDMELFQAIHGGETFSSACHTKTGELFCYVKLDALAVPKEGITDFLSRFAAALDSALRAAGLGCVIGSGRGLRYAYLDLVLSDFARGAQLVRQTLSQAEAPVRSWLLFHDDDLAAEWVGIHPQTPPPPA